MLPVASFSLPDLIFLTFVSRPLFQRCGPQPNAKLLLNYGFVDEDNPYDRIIVEVIMKLWCLTVNFMWFSQCLHVFFSGSAEH